MAYYSSAPVSGEVE